MNVYLIGYRGSGKTSVAKPLAELLGWETIDSDNEIEALAGTTISEIFASEGESGFRKLEAAVIEGICMLDSTIVSLGGGAILDTRTRKRIRETGKVAWLQIAADTAHHRITGDKKSADQRPDLTQSGGIREIEQMLEIRTPIYQSCAELTLDANKASPEQLATRIFDHFESELLHRGGPHNPTSSG